MIYCFDIDGTICSTGHNDYADAQPFRDRIEKINELYEEGHLIYFSTARGMGRTRNDAVAAYQLFFDLTTEQLESWGVKYHKLYMGKISADKYVDDKGENDEQFFAR